MFDLYVSAMEYKNTSLETYNRKNSIMENEDVAPSVVKVKILHGNSVTPEPTDVDRALRRYKESKPYVLNPKYASPTSLPLYFYFGYQLLQELRILDRCGHVSFIQHLLQVIINKEVIKS
jgi:hypothetical protein